MTTIAWDGKTLAVDRQSTNNGIMRTTTKLFKVGKLRVSFCGSLVIGMELLNWVRNGRIPEEFPESATDIGERFTSLIVVEKGRLLSYEASPTPITFEDKFFATGSGRDFATASLHTGATAIEAIQITSMYDAYTGKGIDYIGSDLVFHSIRCN